MLIIPIRKMVRKMEEKKKISDKIQEFLGAERWQVGEKKQTQKNVCAEYVDREFLIEKYKTKFPIVELTESRQPIRL